MTGQLPSGTFDVTKMWVTEPPTEELPSEAIPKGGTFTLHATFTGNGKHWDNMTNNGFKLTGEFHLEGIGSTEGEADYVIPAPISLVAGQKTYDIAYTVPAAQNKLAVGLYRCGFTVVCSTWYGACGFIEGLVIQIY